MPREAQSASATANALRADIVAGQLEPGAPLRQLALAERYGTSRMPIRQALQQLAAEGFVALEGPTGAHVLPLDKAEWDEMTAMRAALEPLALKRAIANMTPEAIAEATDLNKKLSRAAPEEVGMLNGAFHMALYRPCRMPRLLATIEDLQRRADRYLRAATAALNYDSQTAREHADLLRACERRDPARANSVLTKHIETAGAALADALGTSSETA